MLERLGTSERSDDCGEGCVVVMIGIYRLLVVCAHLLALHQQTMYDVLNSMNKR